MTRAEAQQRIEEIRASPEFFARWRNPAQHEALVRELNELAPTAYAEEPEPPEARARRGAAAKAREELEKVRAEPAFWDAAAEKHEALQQKVAELTAIVVADEG